MDFFLGIIIGITGFAIYLKFKEFQLEAKKPKRGRPPKKVEVKDKNESS